MIKAMKRYHAIQQAVTLFKNTDCFIASTAAS